MDNDLSFKDLRRMIGRWTETDPEHVSAQGFSDASEYPYFLACDCGDISTSLLQIFGG